MVARHGRALYEIKKCREKNKDLHMVFVDLEKAFDRIPRDLIWWCLRKKGVPEEYVNIVHDRSCKTKVVTQKGETEYFAIEVGLHQGSALSPLLFIMIMGVLTENIEKDPPLGMMFADDLVLYAMTREEVEEDLETWRVVFERHGLKISRTKTEYLPSPTNDTGTTVKIVDAELPTVTSFKYLGSLFTSEGGSQADVNNRMRIGWMKWKEVSGVMCDRKCVQVYTPARSLRSAGSYTLVQNKSRTAAGDCSFVHAAATVWNALPVTVTSRFTANIQSSPEDSLLCIGLHVTIS